MLVSVLLHVAAVFLFVLLSPSPLNVVKVPAKDRALRPRILLQPIPSPSKRNGGGGSDWFRPPSRGQLPRLALRQFTPPVVTPMDVTPKLVVEPTILLASTVQPMQPVNLPIGLPNGVPGPPSGGAGKLGGLGGGRNGGVGNGDGPSMEGIVAETLRAGINPPVLVFKLEPEYSEQARKARIQGTVCVQGVIDDKGLPRALRIREPLGFGLDEQALEAVSKWRFRPATRGGKPLAIHGAFYVTFRLL